MKKTISVESLIESLNISQEKFDQWAKRNISDKDSDSERTEPDFLFFDLHSPVPKYLQRNKNLMTGTGY